MRKILPAFAAFYGDMSRFCTQMRWGLSQNHRRENGFIGY